MGLFGGKTVLVASTVYNMAGDVTNRVNFLKTTVASNVISNTKFSMSDTIGQAYISGPGIKARNFVNWAFNNYSGIGVPAAKLVHIPTIDKTSVQGEIPHDAGYTVQIQDVRTGMGDPSYWAEQYLMLNSPDILGTNWNYTYDSTSNQITINYDGGALAPTVFTPTNFDPEGKYFYTVYLLLNSTPAIIGSRLWIYKLGDGNAVMDAIPTIEQHPNSFYPMIPVRIENQFLSSTYMPDTYALAKRAYRKATSQKFDDLVKKLSDNTKLSDIDHAFMVYGVALNTTDTASKKYLYNFFKYCSSNLPSVYGKYTLWRTNDLQNYINNIAAYNNSRTTAWGYITPPMPDDGMSDSPSDPAPYNPVPFYPAKDRYQAEVRSSGPLLGPYYHMLVNWAGIEETLGTGLKKPDAKIGDLWFDIVNTVDDNSVSLQYPSYYQIYDQVKDDIVDLSWQVDANNWKTLRLYGLRHHNYVYQDKSVDISAVDALNDTDESGFIVPLHYETVRAMSLIDSTQMMTASMYLILNSYQVVKQKWYQTGIFKIAVFIIMIAITVATGGAGAIGLLGTNLAVGTALGLTGLAAVIVGAIANALAAFILTQLISIGAKAVFGAKIGAIVAVIASLVAMQVGSSLMAGQTLASSWGNLMSASNIMNMTSAVGNGVAGYMQASAMEVQGKTKDLMDNYKKESSNFAKKYSDMFGEKFGFDPMQLTGYESADQFLTRTLMTGTDIADMSMDMVTNFADLTLNLDTNFSS